jgi:hypothetical protein
MSAAVRALDLVTADAYACKNLTTSFVSILTQGCNLPMMSLDIWTGDIKIDALSFC